MGSLSIDTRGVRHHGTILCTSARTGTIRSFGGNHCHEMTAAMPKGRTPLRRRQQGGPPNSLPHPYGPMPRSQSRLASG